MHRVTYQAVCLCNLNHLGVTDSALHTHACAHARDECVPVSCTDEGGSITVSLYNLIIDYLLVKIG